MIGRIAGVLLEKNPPQLLIDVNGVGYEIEVPMSTFYNLPAIGQSVSLHVHMVVREDAQLLFGFGSEDERRAFRQLIRISGVGARIALALLSGLSVAELVQAVALLRPRRKLMDELVNMLIEKETIEGEEFQAVVERHGGSLDGQALGEPNIQAA